MNLFILSSRCLGFYVFGKSKYIAISDIIKDCVLQAIPVVVFKNHRYYQNEI